MTESFLRQRRNLFVVSGIFLFCYFAKVDVSQLTIIGVSFEGFGNPEAVYLFLWIGLGYFFYRFSIYFYEDEFQKFKEYFEREMELSVNPRLLRLVSEKYCDLNENCLHSYKFMKKQGWLLKYQIYVGEEERRTVESVETSVRRTEIWKYEVAGLARFLLFTPAITNYILPAVVTIYVFWLCGFSNWSGAFRAIFT
ncbi:hypothetical protein [Agaribacterium haliotis]|uniref:hypothetical protein n=1 Tax=Agaribacterium haliotis TaxID=2013869 RepID=UPI000BB59E56|nr:hypothetical protein [Agaribacterium haliotis]